MERQRRVTEWVAEWQCVGITPQRMVSAAPLFFCSGNRRFVANDSQNRTFRTSELCTICQNLLFRVILCMKRSMVYRNMMSEYSLWVIFCCNWIWKQNRLVLDGKNTFCKPWRLLNWGGTSQPVFRSCVLWAETSPQAGHCRKAAHRDWCILLENPWRKTGLTPELANYSVISCCIRFVCSAVLYRVGNYRLSATAFAALHVKNQIRTYSFDPHREIRTKTEASDVLRSLVLWTFVCASLFFGRPRVNAITAINSVTPANRAFMWKFRALHVLLIFDIFIRIYNVLLRTFLIYRFWEEMYMVHSLHFIFVKFFFFYLFVFIAFSKSVRQIVSIYA